MSLLRTPGAWRLSAVLLILFLGMGLLMVRSAPRVRMVDSIEVHLPDEIRPQGQGAEPNAVVLGFRELGQRRSARSAEGDHLRVWRTADGWMMANVSRNRRVDVRTDLHGTLFLKRWPLRTGDRIALGDISIEVGRSEAGELELRQRGEDRLVRWAGGRLSVSADETVYRGHWSAWRQIKHRLGHGLRERFRGGREAFLFSLGGGVNTPNRWKIDGISPDAARVYRYRDQFFLGPGRGQIPVQMARPGEAPRRFGQREMALDGELGEVKRIILGRTRYRVRTEPKRLVLVPTAGLDLWPEESTPPVPRTPGVTLRFRPEPVRPGAGISLVQWFALHWRSLAGALGFFAALLIVPAVRRRIPRARPGAASGSADWIVLFCGLSLSLVLWRSRGETSLSVLLLLAWISWTWATFRLARRGCLRGGTAGIWNAALLLAGAGALTLAQLALGAGNSRWFDFARKHALLLASFGWAVPAFAALSAPELERLWKGFCTGRSAGWRGLRAGLMAGCLGLLFLQLGFGGEQGLWDLFQPAELAKILLAATAAFVGMDLAELRNMDSRALADNPIPLVWKFLKILALVGIAAIMALAGVRDFSPLFILAVFFLAWVWVVALHPWKNQITNSPKYAKPQKVLAVARNHWKNQPRSLWVLRGAVVCAVLGTVLAGWWIRAHPGKLPEGLPSRDRLLVWAAPEAHPHSGEQVGTALRYAGRGGWTGGTASVFGGNGGIMRLPVVQNDFIGGFVLFKFGALAGMVLLWIQAIYVRALFDAGAAAERWGKARRSFDQRMSGRILQLALLGLAWMQVAHWCIAWANALGLLPVMGQPMTWISAANSHLIFFAFPALLLAMGASRMAEET